MEPHSSAQQTLIHNRLNNLLNSAHHGHAMLTHAEVPDSQRSLTSGFYGTVEALISQVHRGALGGGNQIMRRNRHRVSYVNANASSCNSCVCETCLSNARNTGGHQSLVSGLIRMKRPIGRRCRAISSVIMVIPLDVSTDSQFANKGTGEH